MKRLNEHARGQECQVRIPNVCNFNNETVVLAHPNGAGKGMKHDDLEGAWCCSACHDVVDGRAPSEFDRNLIALWFLDGAMRTREQLREIGVLGRYRK